MSHMEGYDYINYNNGSQHPFRGGGLYLGKVVSVDSGNRASIRIPSLGLTVRSCPVVGTTKTAKPALDDSVVCAFLENDNQEVIVIGRINISLDVYATKEEFSSLLAQVNTLAGQLASLDNRVTALETP